MLRVNFELFANYYKLVGQKRHFFFYVAKKKTNDTVPGSIKCKSNFYTVHTDSWVLDRKTQPTQLTSPYYNIIRAFRLKIKNYLFWF